VLTRLCGIAELNWIGFFPRKITHQCSRIIRFFRNFPATDVRVIVLSFQENANEWLQHHTSLSANNTLLQHRRQEHLAYPQERMWAWSHHVTTNTTHTSTTKAPRSPRPTNHCSCAEKRWHEASEWRGLAELGKVDKSADDGVHCAPEPHNSGATISESHKALAANAAPSRREATPKRRRWPVQQSGPRVSPGMKGRSSSTQEHASKEEVAPAGVTVIRTDIVEQGFHPGMKPHPDETETSSSQTPPRKIAYQRGGACQQPPQEYHHTPRKDRDGPAKAGQYTAAPKQDLRLPPTLRKTDEVRT
jgi:hypothetical protein